MLCMYCIDERRVRQHVPVDLLHSTHHHRLVLHAQSCTRRPQRVSTYLSPLFTATPTQWSHHAPLLICKAALSEPLSDCSTDFVQFSEIYYLKFNSHHFRVDVRFPGESWFAGSLSVLILPFSGREPLGIGS